MQYSFTYRGIPYHREAEGVFEPDDTLCVTVEKKQYPDFTSAAGTAESYTLWFENTGETDSGILEDIFECDTLVPIVGEPKPLRKQPTPRQCYLEYWYGLRDAVHYADNAPKSAEEFARNREYLCVHKQKSLHSGGGRSSDQLMPFFHLHGEDTQGRVGGAFIAIGWTGGWRANFSALPEDKPGTLVQTGLRKTHFVLHPGEKLRTAGVLIMPYLHGEADTDGYNLFRRLLQTHFDHRTDYPEQPAGLFCVEMWGGLPGEENTRRVRQLQAHNVDFDQLWIDAGWYGEATDCESCSATQWMTYTGDWSINPYVHPAGLLDVKAALDEGGQRMMLWAEPERVTDYVLEHNEFYIAHPETVVRSGRPLFNMLNLGDETAVEYILNTLSALIEKLHIGCYRQDFNMEPDEFFEKMDTPDRIGISEIRHIMGLYALWDGLHRRFPDLVIDNCSSGARRIDYESNRRAVQFFRSDYQCSFDAKPEVCQVHNTGVSMILPSTGCSTKVKADTYTARSSYSSGFGLACYNAAFQSMDEADFVWAAGICSEYRRIQPYFLKDFYNLGSEVYDDTAWCIWQYDDPERESGVLLLFRREQSPYPTVSLTPRHITPLTVWEPLDDNAKLTQTAQGLDITLPEKRSSTVILYRSAKAAADGAAKGAKEKER